MRHLWIAIAGLLIVGCADHPGKRIEVIAGPEGQVQTREVPYTAPQRPMVEQTPPPPTDPDLAQITTMWPKLNPSDRAALVDMAKHLSQSK